MREASKPTSVLHTLDWNRVLPPPSDVAHTENCQGCEIDRLRSRLGEIEQLVRHEWRLKDHNPVLVLNTIEQVLDAE